MVQIFLDWNQDILSKILLIWHSFYSSLGMNGTQVGIFEKTNKVRFRGLTQTTHRQHTDHTQTTHMYTSVQHLYTSVFEIRGAFDTCGFGKLIGGNGGKGRSPLGEMSCDRGGVEKHRMESVKWFKSGVVRRRTHKGSFPDAWARKPHRVR